MNPEPVFVDTSALVALVSRDDSHHGDVAKAFALLAEQNVPLVTHSYVLVETGALVRRRFGTALFTRIGEVVWESCEVVWVDARLHSAAWSKASEGAQRGPGLVDWASFLLMREMGLSVAISLDRHFREQGSDILRLHHMVGNDWRFVRILARPGKFGAKCPPDPSMARKL